jgi:hypothetical protein
MLQLAVAQQIGASCAVTNGKHRGRPKGDRRRTAARESSERLLAASLERFELVLWAAGGGALKKGSAITVVEGARLALERLDRKRSPEALLAFRVTSMVVRPEARSFRPTLWSTQMTTRRRKCTAV